MIASPLGIKTSVVTLRSVFPLMPFLVALIEVVPTATLVATPPGEVIVATAGRDEAQATVLVISADDPSENVPVAIKLTVFEIPEIEELAGVTAIDCKAGSVTVN